MKARLLVCDLDNTLYDWVGYFVPAFYAMADEVVRLINCDREQLLDDFQCVHRLHHDSEHPYALVETATVRRAFPNSPRDEITRNLRSAFEAFDLARKEHLRLYPGVRHGLDALCDAKVTLIAHTESKLNGVVDRMTRLGLSSYFLHIYCRERAAAEYPDSSGHIRRLGEFPMEKVRELSHHQRKPDPSVLLEICSTEGTSPSDTAYVGDSILRDVYLANRVGAYSIWAKYGAAHAREDYLKLVRVSHWTSDDVAQERQLGQEAGTIRPNYILERQFDEILEALELS